MLTTIECAGHPRDMGLAQGAAAKAAIRQEVARLDLPVKRSRMPSLRPLVAGELRGAGAGRELFRHFAHQAERLEGVARAAGVPMDSILELHLRVRAGGEQAGLLARRSTVRARSVGGGDASGKRMVLERTLPQRQGDESGWILRESRPEVGFRSIEVALPWLVSAVAGVNEGGLAVVGGPLLWGAPGRGGRPSSLLLVQECLQRFEDLEGAIGWCKKRPVEGEQSLVLADASGEVVTILVSGGERRIQTGDGELHLEAGELPGPSSSTADVGGRAPEEDRVWLDPKQRRLRIRIGGVDVDALVADAVAGAAETREG